ncbi:MAG: AMP-binding protein [Sporichthyaceae bacterium]
MSPQAPPAHPGLRADSRLTPELIASYLDSGMWDDTSLRGLLSAAAAAHPDRVAVVSYAYGTGEPTRMTYAEFDAFVTRLAHGLTALGVGRGTSVALMLPNSVQIAALVFAIFEAGGVYTGIPVAYGERETGAILAGSGAEVLVVPAAHRRGETLDTARTLRREHGSLRHLVVLDDTPDGAVLGPDETPFAALLDAPVVDLPPLDAGAVCHVGFTSGTTGAPKGVLNSSQTLFAVIRNWVEHVRPESLGDPFVNLIASPIGHHTGFLWGVMMTAFRQGTAVFLDRWKPDWAAEVILAERVTASFSAPTFVQDLMGTQLAGHPDSPLRIWMLAGGPVPRSLPAAAAAALGGYMSPGFGMTECGSAISCAPHLADSVLRTDGAPTYGMEARVVDATWNPTAHGEIGDLQIRGPAVFLGYANRPDANAGAFDADGWFHTGDTALTTPEGFIALAGRTKDIVIRGGENIPVQQVEALLQEHPQITAVAVVGYPDERLGERACAVVRPVPGAELDLRGLCDWLLIQGLSAHYLPERLQIVEHLPVTTIGKVDKAAIRRLVAAAVETEGLS